MYEKSSIYMRIKEFLYFEYLNMYDTSCILYKEKNFMICYNN